MGRWCYQVMEGRGREVLLVNVYQVCEKSTSADGKLTNAQQQRIMLSEENRDNRDPRKQFRKDLIDLLRKFKQRNGNIIPILMGDWNDDRGKKTFAAEAEKEFGLIDAFKQKFPDSEEFKTHIDGSKRIDYILTLPWIAEAMTNIVYEPFQYRLAGDHRGVYFDIDEEILFCDRADEIYDYAGRLLQSKHKKNADRYLKQLSKHIDENKIAEKLQEAFDKGPNHYIIEMLDRTFTTGCISAEKKCRRIRQKNWTLKMHQLKSKIAVWSIFRSCKRRSYNTNTIVTRAGQLGIKMDESTTEEQASLKIKELRKEVREIYKQNETRRDEELLEAANIADNIGKKQKAKRLRQLRHVKHKIKVFKRLNFQRGKDLKSTGIDKLEVLRSWPTLEEYDEDVTYNLQDPTSI